MKISQNTPSSQQTKIYDYPQTNTAVGIIEQSKYHTDYIYETFTKQKHNLSFKYGIVTQAELKTIYLVYCKY